MQLILFCAAAFILFAPIISKSFASDDYQVMKRVALDRVLWIKGFFRPLSDITLFFNYLIGGFDPAGYYIFNILAHGVNSFLLFRLCLQWKWENGAGEREGMMQTTYALIAALLFLSYPYHSEGIAWILGRGAVLASLLAMCACLLSFADLPLMVRVWGVCLCFFTGLAAYESIIALPLMIFVLLSGRRTPRRAYLVWGIALGGTLALHLAIRVWVSGGVLGSYGESFFGRPLLYYAGNLFRAAGRLFLPPSDDTQWMIVSFVVLLVFLSFALYFLFKRSTLDHSGRNHFLKLLVLLGLTAIIPIIFGVSTRTSESDRFLYFPSFFCCCCISFFLVQVIRSRNRLFFCVSILIACQIIFLEKNNLNWLKASRMTKNIIATIRRQGPGRKIFVINLPDEQDGAYIFRLGLSEALIINGMGSSKVSVINHLTRDEMLALPDSLPVERRNGALYIAPSVMIRERGADSLQLTAVGDPSVFYAGKGDAVLYWNRHRLIKLK